MTKNEIVETLKNSYSRDIRKQLVKSILQHEKANDALALEKQYKIINQIFSYVLHESNWNMSENSKNWDHVPLEIMIETFPNIGITKWYNEQNLHTKQSINVLMDKREH